MVDCTLKQFARTYSHEIAYCGDEWFEKQLGLLIPQVSYMATEMDDAFLTESILKKIPGMGPQRINLLFDNADYFGYETLTLETLDKDDVLENPSLYIKCSKDAVESISDTKNITNDWLTR
tara:strand:- start:83 stop:445 length:363 start_codon:yes stop_codon:yes gene_type:complete